MSSANEMELIRASEIGDLEEVRRLLERGTIDVNAANEDGWTPLHIASVNRRRLLPRPTGGRMSAIAERFIERMCVRWQLRSDVDWTVMRREWLVTRRSCQVWPKKWRRVLWRR